MHSGYVLLLFAYHTIVLLNVQDLKDSASFALEV